METSTEHKMILPGGSACVVGCGAAGTSGYMETSTEHKMILPGGSACVVGCGAVRCGGDFWLHGD